MHHKRLLHSHSHFFASIFPFLLFPFPVPSVSTSPFLCFPLSRLRSFCSLSSFLLFPFAVPYVPFLRFFCSVPSAPFLLLRSVCSLSPSLMFSYVRRRQYRGGAVWLCLSFFYVCLCISLLFHRKAFVLFFGRFSLRRTEWHFCPIMDPEVLPIAAVDFVAAIDRITPATCAAGGTPDFGIIQCRVVALWGRSRRRLVSW